MTCILHNSTSNKGYGSVRRNGKKVGKHRAAYEDAYGPIPEGEGYHGTVVRHTCDNRNCINPEHMVLGTQKDNVRDAMERGQHIKSPR